jgi:hypothetical protein
MSKTDSTIAKAYGFRPISEWTSEQPISQDQGERPLANAEGDLVTPPSVASGEGRTPEGDTRENGHRQSRVINRDYVKRWALDYARTNRAQPFTRVSERFLNAIEAQTKSLIRQRIDKHPSRGKTLM